MGKVNYTKEQLQAIKTPGNVIVSAGAGSGKTQVLTERVKYFVKEKGYKLDEFLILTFTNLAAGEMKDRIRKSLSKEGLEEANYVDTSDICTFDSYALSIVKKYHFLLNVSPNISIVDSNIISVRKRTIIEDIFEEKYQNKDKEFLDMIDRFCFKDDVELKELTLKLYDKALLSIDSKKYLDDFIVTYYNDDLIREMIDNIRDIIIDKGKAIIENNNLATQNPLSKKDPTPFNIAILNKFESFFNSKTYDELLTNLPSTLGLRSPKIEDEEEKKNNKKYLKIISDTIKEINSFPKSEIEFKDFILENKPYALKLLEIVNILDERIKKYKEKYQVYEFNDIAKMALNLLKQNKEIRDLIKNKLKMIMIDEYQDTSALQEAFIKEIENNNVYMVGDVKQSIYRFRNARCDIFIDKYDKYKNHQGGTSIDLNKNFRSRKEVLSDINYIFKNLMTKEYGGADYRQSHIIEYGNKMYIGDNKTNVNNHSTFLIHDTKGEETPKTEAELIARDIINKINNHYQVLGKEGLRDCKFSDFCILMDRGNTFDTYAKVFSNYHLPLYVENDENISECDIVLILINILKLIKAINDNDYSSISFKKAFLSVSRSFLFNYTDNDLYLISRDDLFKNDPLITNIKDILYEYNSYPLSKQFEQIIFKMDIYNRLIYSGDVTKNEQYLDMFLKMFADMSKLDYTLDDFLIYMENIDTYKLKITLSSKGSNLDSIRIMNIHKSKGLEFSIVYFSGLYKTFNQEEYKLDYTVSNKYGLILPPLNKEDSNIIKILNKNYEYKEDISERIRLFYVALTRAKEKMIFVLRREDKNKELNDKLRENDFIINNGLPRPYIIDTAKTIVDGYFSSKINKKMYFNLLKEFFIPYPVRYEYINSLTFIIKEDDILNEFREIDELLDNIKTKSSSIKDVIASIFTKVKNHELDNFILTYALNKYDLDIVNLDELLNEDNENNILNLDNIVKIEPSNYTLEKDEKELKLKYENIVFKKINEFKETYLSKEELKTALNFIGYKLNDNYLDKMTTDEDLFTILNNLIINKEYQEDEERENEILNNKLTSLNNNDYSYYYHLINSLYVNHHILRYIIKYIKDNPSPSFNIKLYQVLISKLGYTITNKTINYFTKLNDKTLSVDDDENYFNLAFNEKFIPNNNIKDMSDFSLEKLFKYLLIDNLNSKITTLEFNQILEIFNYELDIDYLKITEEDRKLLDPKYVLQILNVKNVLDIDITHAKSFDDFLTNFINNPIFDFNFIDPTYLGPKLQEVTLEETKEKLAVKEINFNKEEVKLFRASKSLDINSNKEVMEYGTRLHFIMEICDFKNPNLSIFNDDDKKIVNRFLNTPLFKDIKNAKIYKEYEFFDEINQTNGIIDLMLIYNDHIDIIDYKTKNISDEGYDKQLKVYLDFVKNKFNMPTFTYLYSLLNGQVRKCNI